MLRFCVRMQFLGQGTFGSVEKARDIRTNTVIAVKKLLPKHCGNAELRRTFAREIEILTDLQGHPNVVRIIEADARSKTPYYTMEFCNGGSLQSWVASRHSDDTIAFALAEAANGLAAIHGRGGFHRDVKPLNLLAVKNAGGDYQHIKVSDLGFARQPKPGRSMTWNAKGTLGYIAPEVMNGAPFDAPADIFSLAVTACELVTGTRDFRRLHSAPIPGSMKHLITRMGAGSPWDRPTAVEVVHGMHAVRQEIAEHAQAALQRHPAWTSNQPRRVLSSDVGAVFAVLGIATLGFLGIAAFSK